MIQHQTLALATAKPDTRKDFVKPQFVGSVTDLIVPQDDSPAPRPQAFLVEQTSNWTLPTHFHLEHQFQLVVAGGGHLGRHPVRPLDVHYASPHTGYGPLVSDRAGVSYLTLRAVGDTGAWYLPEMREKCMRIPKMNLHASPERLMPLQELAQLPAPSLETLIAPRPDGLAAWLLRLGPGQRCEAPAEATAGGGRFVVVTQGSLALSDGRLLDALSVSWVGPQDRLELVAGPQGLEASILQFPAHAAHSFVEAQAALAAQA